jgi:divalent metal cation (Fe/Co/Zn/Cd) transporter
VLLEDSAALIGLGLAAAGVIATGFFHIAWADGAASVAVGLLLVSVAWVLANETRSLIAGEAVAPIVMERLKKALARIDCITDLENVATLHLGPNTILVALTLAFRRDSTTSMLEGAIREITKALQEADERIVYVYVRPSEPLRRSNLRGKCG